MLFWWCFPFVFFTLTLFKGASSASAFFSTLFAPSIGLHTEMHTYSVSSACLVSTYPTPHDCAIACIPAIAVCFGFFFYYPFFTFPTSHCYCLYTHFPALQGVLPWVLCWLVFWLMHLDFFFPLSLISGANINYVLVSGSRGSRECCSVNGACSPCCKWASYK